jgi:hypothetical protein
MILFNAISDIADPMVRYDSTNTTLTGAITRYDMDVEDGEVVESVIDGTVDMIHRGKRLQGEIVMYGVSYANYTTYKGWERDTVRLWPWGAGAISDTSPTKYKPYVDVFVTEVLPFHKDNDHYQDACIIKFKSEEYYILERASDLGYAET